MSHSPHPPATPNPEPTRRSLLGLLTWLTGGLAAVAFAIPYVTFLVGALRKRSPDWQTLGPLGQFPEGETRWVTFVNPLQIPWDGMTADTGVYVRNLGKNARGEPDFLVFAANCAHLGCPVTWFPQSGLFMCPCHGGVYYENGERASGPPPRGLFKCVWQVSKDGKQLEIQAPHFPTLQDVLDPKDRG